MELKLWLQNNGIKIKKIAELTKIPYLTMQYIINRKHSASLVNAIKIEKVTGGEVRCMDLLFPDEIEKVLSIKKLTKGINHEKTITTNSCA